MADFREGVFLPLPLLPPFVSSHKKAHLNRVKSFGISGQIFGLVSSFLSNRRLWVVLDGKSSQEYPAGVPQVSILGLTPFLLYHNDLPGDVICNIAI